MGRKLELIQTIKNIIEDYGSFYIGELDYINGSPIIFSVGKVLFLGEEFHKDYVMVECILSGASEPFCECQRIDYVDVDITELEEILSACKLWKEQSRVEESR
jgi:hypothetical protein